jgi:hypothetical protein
MTMASTWLRSKLGRPQGVKTGRYLSERVTPEGRAHGECRALPADAPLLWRPQAALEEFCDFRLFQRVRNVAIYAAEFTAASFDQHETHWLAALRARRGRGIFSHWTLTELGGSATLSVTDTCRRRGGDLKPCAFNFGKATH